METQIKNAAALIDIFGEWPSFHDAEILKMLLQRGPGDAFMDVTFHVFRMTSAVDERGYYVNESHTLATIRFRGLQLHCIKWFNEQNAIDDLEIVPATEGKARFTVYFPSNAGCDARFDCQEIEVVFVKPYTKEAMSRDGSVYAELSEGSGPMKVSPAKPTL